MSDSLTISDGKVILITEEGRRFERSEADLVAMMREQYVPPTNGAALPDGVKFHEWHEPFYGVVHQRPPHTELVRWIAADSPKRYGPGTKYRKVRLSVPYAITFAWYFLRNDGLFLSSSNELYFRNEPLRDKSDRVGYPALLNISRIHTPRRDRAWICTQHLRCPSRATWTQQLEALVNHTWNGGFNLSSEEHEGASWYGESQGVHPDLHPVEKWEKASADCDTFALRVPWKPVPLSVGELMDSLFEEHLASLTSTAGRLSRQRSPASLVGRFLNHVQKE